MEGRGKDRERQSAKVREGASDRASERERGRGGAVTGAVAAATGVHSPSIRVDKQATRGQADGNCQTRRPLAGGITGSSLPCGSEVRCGSEVQGE